MANFFIMHFVWIVLQGIFTSTKVEQPLYFFGPFFEFLTITIPLQVLCHSLKYSKEKKGMAKTPCL